MRRTYTRITTHIVFGTNKHEPAILQSFRNRLHGYLGGIATNLHCTAIAVGGVADHVHLLVELPASLAVADLVRTLKCNSSSWVSQTTGARFRWQKGYGAFSVSHSVVPRVRRYILNQEEHHRHRTFREEYETFLRECDLELEK